MTTQADKRIFLAGAAGAIGRLLAPMLRANGWTVLGTTRSAAKLPMLQQLGIDGVVVDVFDAEKLSAIVCQFQPEVVIHQLTDLPYGLDENQMQDALKRNARLRDEGTRNLVNAAAAAGAKRLIAQSIAFVYAQGQPPYHEEHPLLSAADPVYGETVDGVRSLERQVMEGVAQGLVLRYGLLYGENTGFDTPIAPGSIHVFAAARAAALAVTRGEPGIYNIADHDGLVAIDKARQQLGWEPDLRR
ncbi:MAG: NAD-dependent epimerase/dehydratase family protein [Gammaproteobacteria bacterium]|nr:MAG: NAD-dependent epimerase/dehydratase family protein [Gammaproteobacteria bacterium]